VGEWWRTRRQRSSGGRGSSKVGLELEDKEARERPRTGRQRARVRLELEDEEARERRRMRRRRFGGGW
jgi:hypothetical protein